ncbi:MAG: hypothetical protein AAGF01_19500 [Cyanobacteria bacterium P01_G01_bin.38]
MSAPDTIKMRQNENDFRYDKPGCTKALSQPKQIETTIELTTAALDDLTAKGLLEQQFY